MQIQLIDPDPGPDSAARGAVIVPVLAEYGLPTLVEAGQIIDVPPSLAGAGPSWRAPKDGDDLAYLRDTGQVRLNDDGSIRSVHDLGHGLLAQPDIWTRASEDTKPTAPTTTEG